MDEPLLKHKRHCGTMYKELCVYACACSKCPLHSLVRTNSKAAPCDGLYCKTMNTHMYNRLHVPE
eukprot:m.130677 g.130677  ORF g.130677 m.130677 type:complete len:65 (+) comp29495_c0_seq4:39-233(+)